MKINWCKILGHKWIPVYIIGTFSKTKVKFIGAECKRCKFGDDDLTKTIYLMDRIHVSSYSEKHYK
jgi:hypothetical protein